MLYWSSADVSLMLTATSAKVLRMPIPWLWTSCCWVYVQYGRWVLGTVGLKDDGVGGELDENGKGCRWKLKGTPKSPRRRSLGSRTGEDHPGFYRVCPSVLLPTARCDQRKIKTSVDIKMM